VLQAAGQRGKRVPVFLIIDDSLMEKSDKQWVTGHLVVSGQSYPVSWKLPCYDW
jgi:hypothetical protein